VKDIKSGFIVMRTEIFVCLVGCEFLVPLPAMCHNLLTADLTSCRRSSTSVQFK